MRALPALCLVALCVSSALHSERARGEFAPESEALEPVPVTPARLSFWRSISKPNEARAEQLIRQGRAALYPALGLGLLLGADVAVQKRLAIESALTRFEHAVELVPTQREARLYYGKALSFWEDRGPAGEPLDRTPEAIVQFEALRALDPRYEAQEVAFQLGTLYTRRADFARAIAEYRRSLALRSDDDTDSALLGNLAEVTMLDGDLAGSLALYERAARESEGGGRLLALWGSAIALDRLGDHGAALARARRALEEDRVPFAVLRQNGVFFVPAHEVHYYEGLGNLALADKEREAGEPNAKLVRAGRAWLSKPDSVAALTMFERTLAEIPHESALEQSLAPLRASVTHARAKLHGATVQSAPGASPARPNNDAQPSSRAARVLLSWLRAASAFEAYLQRDGGSGPFAEDAREHLQALQRNLSGE